MDGRTSTGAIVALVLVVAVLAWPAAPATGQACSNASCVANALRLNTVYVDPGAQVRVDEAAVAALRARIDGLGSRAPVYIAVLPAAAAEASGGVDRLAAQIGAAMRIPATVGVVGGSSFRATSVGGVPVSSGQAAQIADRAFDTNHPATRDGDVMPMLLAFIDGVDAGSLGGILMTTTSARERTTVDLPPVADPGPPAPSGPATGPLGALGFVLLGAGAVTLGGMAAYRRHHRSAAPVGKG